MKCPILMVNLKKECIFTEQTLLMKIGTISFKTLLPMRKKNYSGIIKCSCPGGNKFIECFFNILWISEAFLLQKIIEMLEKVKICR